MAPRRVAWLRKNVFASTIPEWMRFQQAQPARTKRVLETA